MMIIEAEWRKTREGVLWLREVRGGIHLHAGRAEEFGAHDHALPFRWEARWHITGSYWALRTPTSYGQVHSLEAAKADAEAWARRWLLDGLEAYGLQLAVSKEAV